MQHLSSVNLCVWMPTARDDFRCGQPESVVDTGGMPRESV
jgi:hypothetical protein